MREAALRVAVVGAGLMGTDHILRLRDRITGAEVVSIVEPDAVRASAAAEAALGSAIRSTVEEALAQDAPDAVIVATPGPFHEAVLMPVLEAGAFILCEKPLTPDSEAALRVMAAEQRAGRPRIQVGFMRRFDAGYMRLRDVVRSGEAGELLALHCAHRNASTPPGYADSMLITDSVVHEIDIVPWLAGEPIRAVEVKRTKRNSLAPAGLNEPQLVLLETSSGVLADVEINVNAQFGYQVTTEAVFERGVATAGRPSVGQDRAGSIVPADHLTFATRFADAYDLEVQSWVDAALQGKVIGPTSWDGYLAAVVCEAALEAQESGRRVEIQYTNRPALYEA